MEQRIPHLPTELIDHIATFISSANELKAFRRANRTFAQAGFKPILPFMCEERVYRYTDLVQRGEAVFRELVEVSYKPVLARTIQRLSLGGLWECPLESARQIVLPRLYHLNMALTFRSAESLIALLANHTATLRHLTLQSTRIVAPYHPLEPAGIEHNHRHGWLPVLDFIRSHCHLHTFTTFSIAYIKPDAVGLEDGDEPADVTQTLATHPGKRCGWTEGGWCMDEDHFDNGAFIDAGCVITEKSQAVTRALEAYFGPDGRERIMAEDEVWNEVVALPEGSGPVDCLFD